MKENILIKISGASLKANNDTISYEKLEKIANDIVNAAQIYNIAIVIGGGNIWRGNNTKKMSMSRCQADEMGMLATIINSLALKAVLEQKWDKGVLVYSSLSIPRLVKEHNYNNFIKDLAKNKIVIFCGGVGMPFFSTDTGAALVASEINAKYILMGKNNIDGLYDKDPNVYDDAKFIGKISFSDAINQKLKVADLTCMTMCEENNINILIFDFDKENSIINVLNNVGKFSLIFNNDDSGKIKNTIDNKVINEKFVSDFIPNSFEKNINHPMEVFEYKSINENEEHFSSEKNVSSTSKISNNFNNYESLFEKKQDQSSDSNDSLENILRKIRTEYNKY